ncbi:YhzD family protein [Calidifontibacillus erzurumensis]|uniref:YhzD-like protein n=1 Tax=Calidifontibacillus erzurumensis TaxID=2741433 RepID=A0A8J8GEE7_9BACI|nr:YhzD family protein [Calidifontibacillus erzurumensis]NSL51989.1 hypothetical protein [Calidifontibacillus erzurumensis]
MKQYVLTVFEKNGEKLLEERFDAQNDNEAKQIAEAKLSEQQYLEKTHRCVSPSGKLLLFHS